MGKPKSSTTADRQVAARLRELRVTRCLSRVQVAALIGVTSQQVARYESGSNRVSASMLWDIAQTLSTPIDFFFDGIDDAPFELPPCSRRLADMKLGEIREQRHLEALSQLTRALAGR